MTAYTATFSDGSVRSLKKSKRDYSHAWLLAWTVTHNGAPLSQTEGGFSASEVLAAKALRAARGRYGIVVADLAEVVPVSVAPQGKW